MIMKAKEKRHKIQISLGDTLLCDPEKAQEGPKHLELRQEPFFNEWRSLRADSVRIRNRGNLKSFVYFEVKRRHKNAAQAYGFVLAHSLALQERSGRLFIEIKSPGACAERFYMEDALLKDLTAQVNEVHTIHRYHLIGGKFLSDMKKPEQD